MTEYELNILRSNQVLDSLDKAINVLDNYKHHSLGQPIALLYRDSDIASGVGSVKLLLAIGKKEGGGDSSYYEVINTNASITSNSKYISNYDPSSKIINSVGGVVQDTTLLDLYKQTNNGDISRLFDYIFFNPVENNSISIKEYDYYNDAISDIHNLMTGQLVVIKYPTNNNNTDGSYIVVGGNLLRIDNRYMYGEEFDGNATTTKVGGLARGTKLSTLIDMTNGGDISRILDKILFAPTAPAVALKLSSNTEDAYHNINTDLQIDQKSDDYGIYFSTNSNIREWTFSSIEYVPDRMYVDGELTDIDVIMKYDFVSEVIDISDYNVKCAKNIKKVEYEDYLSNPSRYSDLSSTVIHVSKEYLDSIGGMSEESVVSYNAIVKQLKDNQSYHFVAYAGSKSLYNKTYQTATTKRMIYSTPQISFVFNERTTSSDPIVGSFVITANANSGTLYPTGGYNYHVEVYEYVNGSNDTLIAQIDTNSSSATVSSDDFISSKKFELSSKLDTSKGYINKNHSYYAKLRVSYSYPGVGVKEHSCSSITSLKSIYAINKGTYTGSNTVENRNGSLIYKYTFNRTNENTDYIISYNVAVVEGSTADNRVNYSLGEERSRAAAANTSYSSSLYISSIKIKNDETELLKSSIDSKYRLTLKTPVMTGPSYTVSATASKGTDGKVQLTNITITGSDNDSVVGKYVVKLNNKVLTNSAYRPGDTISNQTGLDFDTNYVITLTLTDVTLNGKAYEGVTTFSSPSYNITPGSYKYRYAGDTVVRRVGNTLAASYKFEGDSGDFTITNLTVSINSGAATSYELGSTIAVKNILYNTTYSIKLYGKVNGVNTLLATGTIAQKTLELPSASNIAYNISAEYDNPILSNPSVVITNSSTMSFTSSSLTYDYVLTLNGVEQTKTNNSWTINYNTNYKLACYATGTSIDGVTSINKKLVCQISVSRAAKKPTNAVSKINGKTATNGRVETTGVSQGNVVSSITVKITSGSGSSITVDAGKDSSFSTLIGKTTVNKNTTETTISLNNVTTGSNKDYKIWLRVYDNVTPSSSANTTSGIILFTYTPPVVKEEFYIGVIEDDGFDYGEDNFNYAEYAEDTPVLTGSTPTKFSTTLDEWYYYSPSGSYSKGFLYVIVPSSNYKVTFATDVAGNVGGERTCGKSNIPYKGNENSVYYYVPGGSGNAVGEVWNSNSHIFIKVSKK